MNAVVCTGKMPGIVKVKVIEGRNLPVMDRSGDTTDAYVELKLGNITYKTEVCRKTLNPQWNSEWYRFEVDDCELQDEPLQVRLMDYDTYSANDMIGKVYFNLNPLLLNTYSDSRFNPFKTEISPIGSGYISGWFPVYDTIHGLRGDVYIVIKLELFSDTNKFRQSSCGIQLFCSTIIPYGYNAETIYGLVEELVLEDDPEYQWIEKIRTPRASNEARQATFYRMSGELQRKIGIKVIGMGGNAVVGYRQCFDIEGESGGVIVRGIGTVVKLVKIVEQENTNDIILPNLSIAPCRKLNDDFNSESSESSSACLRSFLSEYDQGDDRYSDSSSSRYTSVEMLLHRRNRKKRRNFGSRILKLMRYFPSSRKKRNKFLRTVESKSSLLTLRNNLYGSNSGSCVKTDDSLDSFLGNLVDEEKEERRISNINNNNNKTNRRNRRKLLSIGETDDHIEQDYDANIHRDTYDTYSLLSDDERDILINRIDDEIICYDNTIDDEIIAISLSNTTERENSIILPVVNKTPPLSEMEPYDMPTIPGDDDEKKSISSMDDRNFRQSDDNSRWCSVSSLNINSSNRKRTIFRSTPNLINRELRIRVESGSSTSGKMKSTTMVDVSLEKSDNDTSTRISSYDLFSSDMIIGEPDPDGIVRSLVNSWSDLSTSRSDTFDINRSGRTGFSNVKRFLSLTTLRNENERKSPRRSLLLSSSFGDTDENRRRVETVSNRAIIINRDIDNKITTTSSTNTNTTTTTRFTPPLSEMAPYKEESSISIGENLSTIRAILSFQLDNRAAMKNYLTFNLRNNVFLLSTLCRRDTLTDYDDKLLEHNDRKFENNFSTDMESYVVEKSCFTNRIDESFANSLNYDALRSSTDRNPTKTFVIKKPDCFNVNDLRNYYEESSSSNHNNNNNDENDKVVILTDACNPSHSPAEALTQSLFIHANNFNNREEESEITIAPNIRESERSHQITRRCQSDSEANIVDDIGPVSRTFIRSDDNVAYTDESMPNTPMKRATPRFNVMYRDALDTMEYPFLTLSKYPSDFILHIGGTVCARSVKLLTRISNAEEPETRDAWWTELRIEIKSHMKAVACNVVLNYTETTSICDEICVLNACGTAAVVQFYNRNTNECSCGFECAGNSEIITRRDSAEITESPFKPRSVSSNNVCSNESPCHSRHTPTVCSVYHVPYKKSGLPFHVTMRNCPICQKASVPDMLFATIEPLENMPVVGQPAFVHAFVYRLKKDCKSELNAREISDGLPFLEYELNKQLVNKLRIKGMNSLFGLNIQISVGEKMISAYATATGIYLSPLPPPPEPSLIIGKSWGSHSSNQYKLAEAQKKLKDALKRNRIHYQLTDNVDTNKLVESVDNTEHYQELDLYSNFKQTCIIELDDDDDIDLICQLLDPNPQQGFIVSATESLPGITSYEPVSNIQLFAQVWRSRIPTNTPPSSFNKLFYRIVQGLYIKVHNRIPCSLNKITFKMDIPEPDELQICVIGMAVALKESEKSDKTPIPTMMPNISSEDITYALDEGKDFEPLPLFVLSKKSAKKYSQPWDKVNITSLSYIPDGTIRRYLGNLDFIFIRESAGVREQTGGINCFVHNFLMDVVSIVKSHVMGIGGNGMVSFFLNQCVLVTHKNQGQCLVHVGGDAVSYVRNKTAVT